MHRRAFWLIALLVTLLSARAAETPGRVMSFNVRTSGAQDGENAWLHRKNFLVETIQRFAPDLDRSTMPGGRYPSDHYPVTAVLKLK